MYESESAAELFRIAEDLRERMQIAQALDRYTAAEIAGHDADQCGAARWTCHMLLGHYESAWEESDRIAARGGPDPHRYWQGEPWEGKRVLIRCLHGLGDTLQFIRYAPLIRRTAASLTIEAQPKLKELLASSSLADSVITWGEPEGCWDLQMEVNELPRIFRSTPKTIPWNIPYLATGVEPREAGDFVLQIGLVWAASDFDPSRNISVEALRPLFDVPGCRFVSLQAGEGWSEQLPPSVERWSGVETPIEEIAALTQSLDLIVTVDTMNAHLAGGLGCRTWTLLPFQCDWRWMAEGDSTPWYPNMRLFRQPDPGNWTAVIGRVGAELLALRAESAAKPQVA
jgi:hypothetical protein